MTTRGRSNYAFLTNKSGGTVTKGTAIIPDSANDNAFTTTTATSDLRIFGVVVDESIANNAVGLVQLFGSIVEVLQTVAAVTRGNYIKQSGTAGKVMDTTTAATAATTPPTGSIGIALTGVGAAGNIAAFIFPAQPSSTGGALSFLDLNDTPDNYTSQGLKAVRVNTGATALEFYTPAAAANIVKTYNPDLSPASPSGTDDEFEDGVTTGWTQGVVADVWNETDLFGFVHLAKTAAGTDGSIFKAYTPGAAAFTVAFKVHGNVKGAGSNQVHVMLTDSAGALIVRMGMLNGAQWIVGWATGGGFTNGVVTGATPDTGVFYGAIQRDATSNYSFWVSGDGVVWHKVRTQSESGTVGRVYLIVSSFGSTLVDGYWDFVRMFTTQTLKIGNNP